MKSLISICLAVIILLSGCLVSPPKVDPQAEEARRKAQADLRQECLAMRENLPTEDRFFELKGKIVFDAGYGSTLTRDVTQFGRKDQYFAYSIDSPRCGFFMLHQVASITKTGDLTKMAGIRFNVVLKNGKSFSTRTNVPFCLRRNNEPNVCDTLIAAAVNDPEKRLHFRFLTKDPSVRGDVEQAVDHMRINRLDILN